MKIKDIFTNYSFLSRFDIWICGWIQLLIAVVKILSFGFVCLDTLELDYIFKTSLRNAKNKNKENNNVD